MLQWCYTCKPEIAQMADTSLLSGSTLVSCRLQKYYPAAINADKKRQVAVFERKLLPLQSYTCI